MRGHRLSCSTPTAWVVIAFRYLDKLMLSSAWMYRATGGPAWPGQLAMQHWGPVDCCCAALQP